MFEALEKSTRSLYPIIGSPIKQVKSPDLFNRYFAEQGIDAEMVGIDVAPRDLGDFFDQLRVAKNVKGCVVTVPHKAASIEFVDQLSRRAEVLQAVNVIRVEDGYLQGDMVDGLGFLAALGAHRFSCENKHIGVVGIGSAGLAIAHSAASTGARAISIQDLDRARCSFAKRKLMSAFPHVEWSVGVGAQEDLELIVNASPAGMNGDRRLPISLESISQDCLVMDIVTKPETTPWIEAGLERGCPVVYGSEMIQGQFGHIARFIGLEVPEAKKLFES